VTVIYFRSNEKARFKKRALSCGDEVVRYTILLYINCTIFVVAVYDIRQQTLVGKGGGRSTVANGQQSATAVFGVIVKTFILDIARVLFLICLIRV